MAEEAIVVDVPNPPENPNQEAVGNPQNQERREVVVIIGAVCMAAICFVLLPSSDFYTELKMVQKWLPVWLLCVIFVIQLFLGGWVAWRGPFKRELTESKCGAIVKSVIEGMVAVLSLWFSVEVVKQRKMTSSYLHKHPEYKNLEQFNLVDLSLLLMTGLLAMYSLIVSSLLQPGWDFSVMGLFLNLMLSLSLEFTVKGIHAKWWVVLIILYSFILFLGKNINEYRAKSRAKEKISNARIRNWVQIPMGEVEGEGGGVASPDNIDNIGQSFITKAHRRRRVHPTISV